MLQHFSGAPALRRGEAQRSVPCSSLNPSGSCKSYFVGPVLPREAHVSGQHFRPQLFFNVLKGAVGKYLSHRGQSCNPELNPVGKPHTVNKLPFKTCKPRVFGLLPESRCPHVDDALSRRITRRRKTFYGSGVRDNELAVLCGFFALLSSAA